MYCVNWIVEINGILNSEVEPEIFPVYPMIKPEMSESVVFRPTGAFTSETRKLDNFLVRGQAVRP